MDVFEVVKDLISNVGFPIACVIAMFWQMEKERAAHKEESVTWVEALNRNTSVMERIMTVLGVEHNDPS